MSYTLFYLPGSCSLAVHMALREAGLPFTLDKLEKKDKHTQSGRNFLKINSKGSVPTLEFPSGEVLTEVSVILQFVADRAAEKNLAPSALTFDRYRLQEWLNYIATELHKGFGPLWNPSLPSDIKARFQVRLETQFDWLNNQLQGRQYLMSPHYTVADAYLFTVLNWGNYLKINMSKWPNLKAYLDRVKARPATQEALKAEGLLR